MLANRLLVREDYLIANMRASNTTFSSPIINESQLGYAMLLGLYSYFCYKLIMNMKDMHGFKGKEKKDMDNGQKEKKFEDIGGN
jgi:hypothetical protein